MTMNSNTVARSLRGRHRLLQARRIMNRYLCVCFAGGVERACG